MSTKFEQLLDYLVNEEMDKANDLFHEIVVEKSREIYENLISEEEEAEESVSNDEEEAEESVNEQEDEDAEEGIEFEDSMSLDDDVGGDASDELLDKVKGEPAAGEEGDDEEGEEGEEGEFDDEEGEPSEDEAILDIRNAIDELEAAFAELEQSKGIGSSFDTGPTDGEFAMPSKDDEETDETMGMFEGKKRMTREYVENVGTNWEKGPGQENKAAGAGTGEVNTPSVNTKSTVSSGKGKPTSGATAENIAKGGKSAEGTNTGTTPAGKAGGLAGNVKGEFTKGVEKNLSKSSKSSFGDGSSLSKVSGGHGAEKKGAAPSGVGSGSGDTAGQTSIDPATKKQFLKPYSN